MSRVAAVLLVGIAPAATAVAQHPLRHPADAVEIRYARSQPIVTYTLRVDSANLTGFEVEIRLRNVADSFHLAMAAHPEYDDRFWRYVEGIRVNVPGGTATIARRDSALWQVKAPGGEAVVRYRIALPPPPQGPRAAWIPFLSPTGGLVGGPHAFMFVAGAELGPSHVALELPSGWEIATGLEPTSDPRTFFAPSVGVLVDSPIQVGRFRSWRFAVDGVPHRVVYWPLPDAVPFDTAAFVDGIERLARQAVALFGRAPYREYVFLYQDGAFGGGLEHVNSVTVGAPSAELARDPASTLPETAHEFIHTWNLMRIRPAERTGVSYRPATPSRGLWWSEGLTIFYADLLLRRAGLPVFDSTRIAHLEGLIARYLASPGNSRISPERVSLVAYGAPPGSLGDYSASTHIQGEVLGAMLDLIVRDATGGRRSMDDVMRAMLERFSGERGFTGADIEVTVAEVCGCNVGGFFEGHVRGEQPIDFERYLGLIGLRSRVRRSPALDREGRPAPDLRTRAFVREGERVPRLLIFDPESVWGRAGLHSGDQLVSVNGAPIATPQDFRALLGRARIGDTLRLEVARPSGALRTTVVVTAYDRPSVRIEEVPAATERQRALRARWLSGTP